MKHLKRLKRLLNVLRIGKKDLIIKIEWQEEGEDFSTFNLLIYFELLDTTEQLLFKLYDKEIVRLK